MPDPVGIISELLKQVKKKGKKVLITIDEVRHNESMCIFASQFQIFIREDAPVYLLMTGLHENIEEIINDPALTFLLRSPKMKIEPLSLLQIRRQYKEIFSIDDYKRLFKDLKNTYKVTNSKRFGGEEYNG